MSFIITTRTWEAGLIIVIFAALPDYPGRCIFVEIWTGVYTANPNTGSCIITGIITSRIGGLLNTVICYG